MRGESAPVTTAGVQRGQYHRLSSLVSSEAWLYPDQVVSLYSQTEVWIDRQSRTHRLADMDTSYLRNLRRFLDRGNMRGHLLWAGLRHPWPHLNGEMAQFHAERETLAAVHDAADWMLHPTQAPLYRAICMELARRRRAGR